MLLRGKGIAIFVLPLSCWARIMPTPSNAPSLGTSFRGMQGTYWDGWTWVQSCLFQDWPQPTGLPAVAVAKNLYLGAGYCGACVEVSQSGGNGRKYKGIINSQCTNCSDNALEMSPELWKAVMPVGNDGIRPRKGTFDWAVVPCGFKAPLKLINKDRTSSSWFEMQVAGHNSPVQSLLVIGEGGMQRWHATKRGENNYFTIADSEGLGNRPTVEILVTCTNGEQVHAEHVPMNGRHTFPAEGNC